MISSFIIWKRVCIRAIFESNANVLDACSRDFFRCNKEDPLTFWWGRTHLQGPFETTAKPPTNTIMTDQKFAPLPADSPEFLIHFAQIHEAFRQPEIDALALSHNIPLEWKFYSANVRFPPPSPSPSQLYLPQAGSIALLTDPPAPSLVPLRPYHTPLRGRCKAPNRLLHPRKRNLHPPRPLYHLRTPPLPSPLKSFPNSHRNPIHILQIYCRILPSQTFQALPVKPHQHVLLPPPHRADLAR